jgi:hypothetical protein
MDRAILLHQAAASQTSQGADVILLGDSSCLMNVATARLNVLLPPPHRALNLGTLSYLDLPAYASMPRRYAGANPDRLRAVVLLMHPESLRRMAPIDYYVNVLECYYNRVDMREAGGLFMSLMRLTGLEIFRSRVLSRVLPRPLPRTYSEAYGFTTDLERFLTRHHGSAVDPGQFIPAPGQGNAEYRLAPKLEAASRAFRLAMPRGAKLLVGITPIPQGFAASDFPAVHQRMLADWGSWLEADSMLTNLPAVMRDGLFASTTHLNEFGAALYSELIARELAKYLTK